MRVYHEADASFAASMDRLELILIRDDGDLVIHAAGAADMLVDLTQQLAWIGSAFRSSPYPGKLAYGTVVLDDSALNNRAHFGLSFQAQPVPSGEDSCWLSLFSEASIAHGFLVPPRQDERGLEIPLQLMMAIAGVRHAVEYQGGVLLKGFSHMLVPTDRHDDRVQWHLISSADDDTRLTYHAVLDRCPNRALLNTVSLDALPQTRAFVGWCGTAGSLVGSDDANYENIDYSGCPEPDSGVRLAGGAVGLQQIGLAQLDFTLGPKDGKCHFQRYGPYQRIISAAEKTPVLLYDTADQRAWLVNACEVLLHAVKHRNQLEPFEVDGAPVKLCPRQPQQSAKEVLLRNAAVGLSDYEPYTCKDMVSNIWSILEFLIDQNVQSDRTSGADVAVNFGHSIQGYEFKAVVQERSPFRRKQQALDKTCGGWPTLVRDIDALVLFANGFGDLMLPLPAPHPMICHSWQTVPKARDFMAARVSILKELYDVAGSRLDRQYLTATHLQWHRGHSMLFDSCATPGSFRCRCNRLQQIVTRSTLGRVVPPGLLLDDGAVIFGRAESRIKEALEKSPKQPPAGLYSQPNIGLLATAREPEDLDEIASASSVSDLGDRNDSIFTDSTVASSLSSYSSDTLDVSMVDLGLHATKPWGSGKRPWADEPSFDPTSPSPLFDSGSVKRPRTSRNEPSTDVGEPCRAWVPVAPTQ